MPGLPEQIKPFDPTKVSSQASLTARDAKFSPTAVYHKTLRVDISSTDEDYYYASPVELTWYDKETKASRRYGFLPYPKYAWKLI